MATPEQDQLLDHEYDGIREYDNPTPGWWHAIFAASIVFAVFYAAFWHASPMAWSVQEAWQSAQVAEYKRIFGAIGTLNADEETIQRMRGDGRMQAIAKGIFEGNCAACHARDGGGINGVNLTDNFYKNVKALPDIFTTITNGANAGAMPPWGNRLGQNERVIVAAYVANLRGTTPATPKPAEGVEIPLWPPLPPAPAPAPASPQAGAN
jgi:cytochrome c oxidase cbb3-type subunit 3